MKRILSLLLALLMLVPLIASCASDPVADGTNTPSDTDGGAAETNAETTLDDAEARRLVSDGLPEKNFGGESYTILCDEKFTNLVTTDEMNGDIINDAVYERNAAVAERFNVTFEKIVKGEDSTMAFVNTQVQAGDDAFELISSHIVYGGGSVVKNLLRDWNGIPNVDFSKPWWSDSTVEDMTCYGHTFFAVGDFALSTIGRAYCVFYNKTLAKTFAVPDVYEIVRSGQWTVDKLMELTANIYVDENGDGARDFDDTYGFSSDTKSNVNTYLWAFGNKICEKAEDGGMTFNFYNEKLVSITDKIYQLFFEHDGSYVEPSYGFYLSRDLFAQGNVVFANGYIDMAISHFRELEDEYGILPFPKWDTAQDKYRTMVDGDHEGLAVPKTAKNDELVGIITEALCAESWRVAVPAYYDTALKYKFARDAESIEMLDLIMQGRVFDFGYVYGGFGCAFYLQYLLEAKDKDITSYYAKNEKMLNKTYEKVFNFFSEYSE